MKFRFIIAIVALTGTLTGRVQGQIYDTNNVVVQTFAGSGFAGYVDGVGQQTMFNRPSQIVADSAGNLFVWDAFNLRIRKITPNGTVSTFAGGGSQSSGYGTNVSLDFTYGFGRMAIDHDNNLWITANAGTGWASLYCLRNDAYLSGPVFRFSGGNHFPSGICVDSANNVYVSDRNYQQIYRYTSSNAVLEVFAGSGNVGAADGNGIFSSFNNPTTLAADAADNIYVWDSGNHLIRRINQNHDVTTIAGSGSTMNADGKASDAAFNSVYAMCADNFGSVVIASGLSGWQDCQLGSCVRKMAASTNVTTIAGSFLQTGYTNGAGSLARFSGAGIDGCGALGICLSQGMIFVADPGNQRIRQISFNPSEEPVSPANLQLSTFPGLQIKGTVGRTYRIESSPDMKTWATVATLLLTSSPYRWIDENPVNGTKFYRAFLLP